MTMLDEFGTAIRELRGADAFGAVADLIRELTEELAVTAHRVPAASSRSGWRAT